MRPHSWPIRRYELISQSCGLLVALISSAALTGWFIGSSTLRGIRVGYIPMAPNTALIFLLLGLMLAAWSGISHKAALITRVGALFTAFLVIARLSEYATGADLRVDQWLFSFPGERLGLAPVGKMAFFTAVTFFLLSIALLLLTFSDKHWWANNIAKGMSVIVSFIGLAFLLGYFYGAPLMYGGWSIPMAFNTAASFFLFGAGLLVKASIRDIVERREAKEALRKAHSELEARVQERTAELSKAVASLEEENAERRRIEGALREGQELFKAFMDNSPAVAFMKDEDGGFVYVNETLERRFNLKPGNWFGKTDFDLWPAEVARQLRENDMAVLSARQVSEIVETFPTPDGVPHYWLSLKFPLRDGGGRLFLAGMSVDITERKKAEEELRESEQQLRQAQKLESIGLLAGGIAHDFNNLLTVITGYSDLLLRRSQLDDAARPRVEEIKQAAERAASLTRQLLAFSRKQVLQPKVVDLTDAVVNMDKLLQRLIGADIHLATILEHQLKKVKADPGQIEQVIMNLAVNARDAMPQGGKLTIETKNVYLDEAYARRHTPVTPGPYVMLAVSDTGTGMDAETMERIFEPFFTTKEQGKGTGLGLAMVYGIVKQSGGNIWVYSEPGQGTTFKIYLPVVEAEGESTEQEVVAPEREGGTETILLVEDDEAVRQLLIDILEAEGYTVLAAPNGHEALSLCERHEGPLHLLITDVVMPGMSGR